MRKPAHLERVGGSSPRQRIWETMRALRKFDAVQLAAQSKSDKGTMRTYLRSLEKAGYIVKTAEIIRGGAVYELIKDVGIDAPRVDKFGNEVTRGRMQQHMWRVMRMCKDDFTTTELAALATTDDLPVLYLTAQQYVKHLHRAGYLVKTKNEVRGAAPQPARYRLLASKNTGPRAPMVQKTKCVYDANLGEIVWHEEIEE